MRVHFHATATLYLGENFCGIKIIVGFGGARVEGCCGQQKHQVSKSFGSSSPLCYQNNRINVICVYMDKTQLYLLVAYRLPTRLGHVADSRYTTSQELLRILWNQKVLQNAHPCPQPRAKLPSTTISTKI
jgi:hypothetical protein